ncbi:MAG: hypothetical protein LBM78_02530 [Clostridiales bacterium]|nr:hypothetical protein [Clostridiales bacterium]
MCKTSWMLGLTVGLACGVVLASCCRPVSDMVCRGKGILEDKCAKLKDKVEDAVKENM